MASSPEPLPLPKPVDLGPMDLMVQAAANSTGSSRPEITAAAAASSQSVDQAVTNAQAVNQFADASQVADQLRGESIGNQQQAWTSFSSAQQAQLKAAGYKQPHNPGFFSDIGHALTGHPMSAVEAVGQGFNDTVGKAVGAASPVLNALGAPLRAVQHGERTAFAVINQNPTDPMSGSWSELLHALHSPSDWAKAWNATSNGEKYILPQIQRQVLNKFGSDTFNLAHQLATGTPAQQLVQQAQQQDPSGQLAQKLVTEINDPKTKAAVTALNAGHVSMGHMIMGPDFIAKHPQLGNDMSGALDGIFDWFGDPAVIGGKVLGSARAARYVVNGPEDVANLYQKSASVHRAMNDIGDRVGAINTSGGQGAQDLLSRYRSLGSAAQGLIADNADTGEKVKQYFMNRLGEAALLNGDAVAGSEFFGKQLPYLSRFGQARLMAKGTLEKAINYAADRPATIEGLKPTDLSDHPLVPTGPVNKLVVGGGRFTRRALTLINQERLFNPNDPRAMESLRDIAKMFLPTKNVDRIITQFAQEPDLGKRWSAYRSLMIQLGQTAGLDRDPDVWKAYIGKFASTEGRTYAPKGQDLVQVDGNQIHAGWLLAHQNSGWLVPGFKDMYVMGKKLGIAQATGRAINADFLNSIMERWRPLTLARPAFALRAGGEEAFRFLVSEGPLQYMKAQAARLAYKAGQRAKTAADAIDAGEGADHLAETPATTDLQSVEDQDAGHLYNRLASHLPVATQNKVKTVRDLIREYTVDQVHRAMDKTGLALTTPEYRASIDSLIDHGALEPGGALYDKLGAMHGWDPTRMQAGYEGMDLKETKKLLSNGRLTPYEIAKTGVYKDYNHADPDYLHMWYSELARVASDDWGREALLWRKPMAKRIEAVANALENHPLWKDSILSTQDPDGRLVATGEITKRQAAEAHAARIVRNVDRLTKSRADFKPIQVSEENGKNVYLADHLLKNGKPPTLPALGQLAEEHRPTWVTGPEVVPRLRDPGLVHRYSDWMFTKLIGPQMNAISRTPLTIHNYTAARKELTGYRNMLKSAGFEDEHVENMVHDAAQARAIDKTLPFVHNPHLRSQMSALTRNLAPFWFAQEQFYKRWARTLVESPAALRRAQLLNMGVKHTGFVHTDPSTNQQYFVYPGSALVQSVIAGALSKIGVDAQTPVAGDLVGQVSMLNPGIERLGGPSFGPMVVIPLNGLKSLDPHLTQAVQNIEGQQAASSSFLQAALPTVLYRLVETALPQLDSSQYSSAQMAAITALEATGHGIGEPATNLVASTTVPNPQPGDYVNENGVVKVYQPDGTWRQNDENTQQTYLNRVKNWSRVMLFTRMLFGMAAPASPQMDFNPKNLHDDYIKLITELGVDQGTQQFLALHPDATFETLGKTENKTGGTLPATQAAMSFLDGNPALTQHYSLAAPFFIPQPSTAGKFDLAAYQEQLANGFRVRKDPNTFYQQGVYQEAANTYYQNETAKNQLVAQNPGQLRKVDAAWTQWSQQFMLANPIFAKLYSDQGEADRMRIMTQVGDALRSGAAPNNPQTSALANLYDSWVYWKSQTGNFGNPNAPAPSSSMVRVVDQAFATWLGKFVQQNPGVQPLVDRTIRPDLTQTLNSMAANGVSVTL